MLAQVLHRDLVLELVEATAEHAERTATLHRDRRGGLASAVKPDDLDMLAETLRETLVAERATQLDVTAVQTLGSPAPPKHDFAYMPRGAVASIVQSAFDTFARESFTVHRRKLLDDRRSGIKPHVTDEHIADVPLTLSADGRRVWGRFEVAKHKILSDPRWVKAVFAMVHRSLHGRVPFNPQPAAPPALADPARLILIGDWGSGLPRALDVRDRVRTVLAEPDTARRDTHVIHLGDVYYAGERKEYVDRFLDPWPVTAEHSDVGSFTLAGNHDMYTGGEAFYATALADPRFALQERSSWFRLANDHWQVLGLDSSYEDGGLYGDQAMWVRRMRAQHPDAKTILLTHHQFFSAYEDGAVAMRAKLMPVAVERPVDAWFWGHEHRCLVYRDHENVRFASCIGHGGIPEYVPEQALTPPKGLVYEYRDVHSSDPQPWITFGFAVVDLDGPRMRVRYIDEIGREHWSTEHE